MFYKVSIKNNFIQICRPLNLYPRPCIRRGPNAHALSYRGLCPASPHPSCIHARFCRARHVLMLVASATSLCVVMDVSSQQSKTINNLAGEAELDRLLYRRRCQCCRRCCFHQPPGHQPLLSLHAPLHLLKLHMKKIVTTMSIFFRAQTVRFELKLATRVVLLHPDGTPL